MFLCFQLSIHLFKAVLVWTGSFLRTKERKTQSVKKINKPIGKMTAGDLSAQQTIWCRLALTTGCGIVLRHWRTKAASHLMKGWEK